MSSKAIVLQFQTAWVTFTEPPTADEREQLAAAGFRYSTFNGSWMRKQQRLVTVMNEGLTPLLKELG